MSDWEQRETDTFDAYWENDDGDRVAVTDRWDGQVTLDDLGAPRYRVDAVPRYRSPGRNESLDELAAASDTFYDRDAAMDAAAAARDRLDDGYGDR